MKLKDYKGYTIEVAEYDGEFSITETEYRYPTLKQAEAKIDAIISAENKAGFPLEAIKNFSWSTIAEPVTILSKNSEDKSVWYRDSKGNRHKEDISKPLEAKFFKDNNANKEAIARYRELNAQINKLEKERSAIKLTDPINFNLT